MEWVLLAIAVYGIAAVVMTVSFICAKCEDETEHMARDIDQGQYGSLTD